MSKYAEYLKEQGATEEEIKILDSPITARAFDKLMAERQEALEKSEKTEQQMRNFEQRVNSWYTENNTKVQQTQNQVIAAQAEAARYKAALASMKEQGLIDVAKDLGWEEKDLAPKKEAAPADERYVTKDYLREVARQEGRGIATMTRLAAEHAKLFPNAPPPKWDYEYDEFINSGSNNSQSFEQYYANKYKVNEARESAVKAQREAEIAKWKEEGAKEKETELASKFGNPEMRPLTPSYSPFTKKPTDTLREKQPWQHADGKLADDRVARATKNLMEKQFRN